jgi:hypothetical protein
MNWKSIFAFVVALLAGLFWSQVGFTIMAVAMSLDRFGYISWQLVRSLILLAAIAAALTWGAVRLYRAK